MNKCLNCGKEVKNKYCNVSCKNKHQNKGKKLSKEHVESIKKARQSKWKSFKVECCKCKKEIIIKEYNVSQPKKERYFCSRSCANSKNRSKEVREKISKSVKNSEKFKNAIKKTQENNKINYENIKKKREENWRKKILEEDYENLSFQRLRKRVIYEQEEKCNKCNLNEWMGEKISLELEHKDGNNNNNERNNLEALCPNCHSLTKSWRGRNAKKNNRNTVSDEELFNVLVKNEFNLRKSLIEVGLSPKGGNYKRCHKIKKEFNSINKNNDDH